MAVSTLDAVSNASNEWAFNAGARRLGKQQKDWPLLTRASNIINGQGNTYAESLFDRPSLSSGEIEQLADYTALSTWGHILDGWRYLSLAASAIIQASRNHALHLAYYAELRAALGILATSGISVLNRKHYSISSTGAVYWFQGSTHKVAWEALSEWAKIPANAVNVIDGLGVNLLAGVPWLDVCRATSVPIAIASNWLQNWTFDLTQLADDKIARNEASYRPTLDKNCFTPLLKQDLSLIRQASEASVHSEIDGASPVQTALVEDLCMKSAEFRFGTSAAPAERFWREATRDLINQHRFSLPDALQMVSYIKAAKANPAGKLLNYCETTRRDVYGVFSRAFFLLQLASAMLILHRKAIARRASSGSIHWPTAIIRQFGFQSQLWPLNQPPSDLATIESDTELVNEFLGDRIDQMKSAICANSLWKAHSYELTEICRFERHFIAMAAAA